jgi:hypothetical protein|tara:strand:+ start:248 stop:766 length:519 start_codon:yes stop_codon:yes gene_type:complete
MIDFKTFQLDRLSKLLYAIRGYTDNNLRFPKAGEMVEKALAEYSNDLLERVNLPGIDLVTKDKISYESKVTQFKNKSGIAVRGLIIKNRRAAKDYDDKLADYFIISDVKSGKACCVSSDKLYNFKDTGAVYTASCDPDPADFFLTGYNDLNESRDYFEESEDYDLQFIKSIN